MFALSESIVQEKELKTLLSSVKPLFEKMLNRCAASEADFREVESSVKDVIAKLRPLLVSSCARTSISCCSHDYACPDCGRYLTNWGKRRRKIMTSEGEADITLRRYRCQECGCEYSPVLEGNGLANGQFTLGAIHRIVTKASDDVYAKVSEKIPEIGIHVSAKEVDRQVTQVAQWHRKIESDNQSSDLSTKTASKTEGASKMPIPSLYSWDNWEEQEWAQISVDAGKVRSCEKAEDGTLKWFDARCGLIKPLEKDPNILPFYTGGVMESWDPLFECLSTIWNQRPSNLKRLVFISDAGAGIWDRKKRYFPDAVEILDAYHASEHVGSAADAAWGAGSKKAKQCKAEALQILQEYRGINQLLEEFIGVLRYAKESKCRDINIYELRKEIRYLYKHRHRMKYYQWRLEGLPIGSGAVESFVKQSCVSRLRKPGMMWTREGANNMLRVRSACLSKAMGKVFDAKYEEARKSFSRFLQPKLYREAV